LCRFVIYNGKAAVERRRKKKSKKERKKKEREQEWESERGERRARTGADFAISVNGK